jgi:hypothetical protein
VCASLPCGLLACDLAASRVLERDLGVRRWPMGSLAFRRCSKTVLVYKLRAIWHAENTSNSFRKQLGGDISLLYELQDSLRFFICPTEARKLH